MFQLNAIKVLILRYIYLVLKKISILIFCCSLFAAVSQTKKRNFKQRELGIFGGASYYLGDLNPRGHFKFSSPAAGIFFRYSTNYRFSWRFGFNYGLVSADDKASKEFDQKERNLNFRSRIYEFEARSEFNFVEYRIGSEKHYFSMFIFGGIGGFYMNPQANIGNGYVNLQGQKTEGQSSSYSKVQLCIPFGVGIKWNVHPIVGLGIEWGPRKLFTDYLDDVSGAYPLKNSSIFTNQSKNGSAWAGSMRGNPRTKDWYFFYGFTLNIKLRNPKSPCHGVGFGGG
jgi:hypothetical protein